MKAIKILLIIIVGFLMVVWTPFEVIGVVVFDRIGRCTIIGAKIGNFGRWVERL